MFGVGMAIAGGCVMGITYGSAEASVSSLFAVVGVGLGAGMTLAYPFASVKDMLQTMTKIQVDGLSPTIPLTIGVSPWVIIILAVGLFLFCAKFTRRKEKPYGEKVVSLPQESWPWPLVGSAIGLIGVVSYPLAEVAGSNAPLALTAGYVGILGSIAYRDFQLIGWEQTLALGTLVGAAGAALFPREWKLQNADGKAILQSAFGGLLLGVGAVSGDGCNITAILIGVPLLSAGSILAGAFMILGWAAANLFLE
jgi:uncharacterized membrane protein YedE/YeeE